MVDQEKPRRGRPKGSKNGEGWTSPLLSPVRAAMKTMAVGQVCVFFPRDEKDLRNHRQAANAMWVKASGLKFACSTGVLVRNTSMRTCILIERVR